MDPRSVLGVGPEAGEEEIAAAYRRLAKAHHPDHAGPESEAAMAQINAAYDLLRGSIAATVQKGSDPRRTVRRGHWLAAETRRALGPELVAALHERERVDVVTVAATWASPRTVVALTERRLLWLLDDAIGDRVRSLRLERIERVEPLRLSWPRRRRAVVRLRLRSGRRLSFADLEPAVARTLLERLRVAVPA